MMAKKIGETKMKYEKRMKSLWNVRDELLVKFRENNGKKLDIVDVCCLLPERRRSDIYAALSELIRDGVVKHTFEHDLDRYHMPLNTAQGEIQYLGRAEL